jgi:hypothetical protein
MAKACVKILAVEPGTVNGAEAPVAHSGTRERHGARAAHPHSVHPHAAHAHSRVRERHGAWAAHSHSAHAHSAHPADVASAKSAAAAAPEPSAMATAAPARIRDFGRAQHGGQGAGRQSYCEIFELHLPSRFPEKAQA